MGIGRCELAEIIANNNIELRVESDVTGRHRLNKLSIVRDDNERSAFCGERQYGRRQCPRARY